MTGSKLAPRRFTLSLTPENTEKVNSFMIANEMTSPSICVNYLLTMAFAATPEFGMQTADRARAYNEARNWSFDQLAKAHQGIAKLLESMKLEVK